MATLTIKHPPLPRYAIWNNKGGVGKTFLTFVLASAYAEEHPDRTVVVIDMCPQANVSEILLGGNGKGADELTKLLKKPSRPTIGGYFDLRILQPHTRTGTESSFLIDLPSINPHIPPNMKLIAGDPSLEIQGQSVNQIASQPLPQNAWGNVHSWALDLVSAITVQHPSAVFFIDCNPSFSAYTEIALAAATRIIVPCTADGSSARAIDNVGQLLYGIGLPPQYSKVNFAAQMDAHSMALPSIHLVPLNRSTQHANKASKAFGAMYGEIKKRVNNLRAVKPQEFSLPAESDPFEDVPDAHSVAVVAAHEGVPLSKVTKGIHDVHGANAQINTPQLKRYKDAVARLVSLL